ncbi:MAG: leucine-rich repeat domain-containing protein [Candidatus Poribacteria bacterium]|nr:leucine-rich repeat domain-containing protein [Candidatus Poribacteria bacterium]
MKLQTFRKFLWLCSLLVSVAGYAQEAPETWMPDANLRAAVIEMLELPEGVALTKEHLKSLPHLEARNSEISNLGGLEYATNLMGLGLCKNRISNLSPLSDLVQMEHLSLCVNQISDISALSKLTNLKLLDLGSNKKISDITTLANLTQLVILNIGNNLVEDITPLANLKQLSNLRADSNKINDLSSLAGLFHLRELNLRKNHITDVSPLANLTQLEKLEIRYNPIRDFSALQHLNLTLFEYDEFCEVPPFPIENRIAMRSFPSIFHAWGPLIEEIDQLFIDRETFTTAERIAPHDLYWETFFHLEEFTTPPSPTLDWVTKMVGDIEQAKVRRQEILNLNPNMLFFVGLSWSYSSVRQFPDDSDYWARDADGNRIKDAWGVFDEYVWNFLKPEVQDFIVEKAVGYSECGLFDGILLDAFVNNGITYTRHAFPDATDEEMLAAVTNILRGIRERVHEDFLIIINAGRSKPTAFTEYVNGSFMELGKDYPGGYNHKGLQQIESTLLWCEENLRAPQINCLDAFGIGTQLPDSSENLRNMRVTTTLSLTHSDGYMLYNMGLSDIDRKLEPQAHIWYDFWDADLGRPVGGTETKGQLYDDRDGVFIREFTNGWAVYNRSGTEQQIEFLEGVSGVASGVEDKRSHVLPDLDGEIYLKSEPGLETAPTVDVNGDGVVNIQDLVIVANALGKAEPDLNGDGVVNIQDLVIVANAFE